MKIKFQMELVMLRMAERYLMMKMLTTEMKIKNEKNRVKKNRKNGCAM